MSLVPGDSHTTVSGAVSTLKILRDENKKKHVLLHTISKLYINLQFNLKDLVAYFFNKHVFFSTIHRVYLMKTHLVSRSVYLSPCSTDTFTFWLIKI